MTALPLTYVHADPADTPHWIEFSVAGWVGNAWIDAPVRVELPRPSLALDRIARLEASARKAAAERAGLADAAGEGLEVRVEDWSATVGDAFASPGVYVLTGPVA